MKPIPALLLITALSMTCLATPAAAAGQETVPTAVAPDMSLHLLWKDGIRMQTADRAFVLKLGGRIMNDWVFFDGNDTLEAVTGALEDGTEFRRARLYVGGDIYERIVFKAQYDFAGGDADFRDVYVGLKGLPGVGTIRVGHFFEPFSLEQNTSSKYITFMERSLPNALAFDRNTGIIAHNTAFGRRASWAAGIFRQTDSFGDSEGSNYNFSLRVTALPWMAQADHLVHLGFAYRNTNPEDNELSFSAKPEAHNTVSFADTGTIAADGMDSLGAELAVVYGPLSFQSEYILASLDSADGTDPDFEGWYAYVSYWLTGESRPYKADNGVFGRVHPESNYLKGEGYGAWEVGLRYSSLDLTDGSVDGGELSNVTVGLNWHLNANSRVMANYVHSELDERGLSDSENVDLLQLRFQVDF